MKQQKRVQPTKKKEESLSYLIEIRDKEGRVLQRISAPSRSYVQQWNQILNLQARLEVAGLPITDTSGNTWPDCIRFTANLRADAPIGTITYGLRVGKGATAVAIDDIALETPCGEGTGVDEFNHQAMVFTLPAVVGATCAFTIRRIFVNNSGATISGVREIGCYCLFVGDGVSSRYGLGFRDVLPAGVTVPDGGSITVIYTIAATVL